MNTALRLCLFAALVTGCTATMGASSGPGPGPHNQRMPGGPPPPAFNSAGWTLLGSAWVDGSRDRDVITVGRQEGKFDKMTMVVTESDLELLDFTVVFSNGDRWSPKTRHFFREGTRERAFDLPGSAERYIQQIEVAYANLPGGGRARIEVYARDSMRHGDGGAGMPPPPPPPPPHSHAPGFDPTGWTLLGSQTIDGRRDHDVFQIGRKAGRFDKIMVMVKDSDLVMHDIVVTFENNDKFEPKVSHTFNAGSRTRGIDLPSADRYIRKIEMKYGNLPGGGKARVEIYGIDTRQGKPAGVR